ncbi:MAG: hypothetical protein QOE08_1063 [Thermoleophilaceae bacterium]|jgi:hypothetical protein|nr:hypothetical protein [Thermoleophilaceae bacterium]
MWFRPGPADDVGMGKPTLNERLRQEACVYDDQFPPSVPEGRLLREPAAERRSMLLRILAKRRARRVRV